SDRTGWWNLYRWQEGRVEPLCPRAAEFGRPEWVFGTTTYAFESAQRIICTCNERGTWRLAFLDPTTRVLEPIDSPYTEIGGLRCSAGRGLFRAGSPTEPTAVVRLDVARRRFEVLRRSTEQTVDAGYLSVPETIEFPTERGRTAYAFYYPPH